MWERKKKLGDKRKMVKEHTFKKHPMRITKGLSLGQEYMPGTVIVLDLLSAAKTGSLSDTIWTVWDVDNLFTGEDRPKDAVAAIMDVAVNDSGSAGTATYLALAAPGIIVAGKTFYCYPGNVNDRVASRLVIVPISSDGKFAVSAEASGGSTLDYNLKLIGWLVGGSLVSATAFPYKDLKAIGSIHH